MYQWIIFIVGSLIISAISWKSLRQPGSHGFYRFFAWEVILALFAINMSVWFYKPFAWYQIISWVLLVLCIVPLVFGVQSLRTRGKPTEHREGEPSLIAFEKTTTLVTSGIYHYIRHPLYSSLFLLAWGIFFKSPSLLGSALAIAATLFLVATARADEAECTRFFGPQYQEYRKTTRMFVPYIF
ncbi:MAG: isoprenylcysteine carboxylmethyltransferase family protein [Anaerolineales bacterium]|nr:isoprenylcysteine carboxylmethyltransferase family protein [Anaerolineales bacterium]